MKSVSLVAPICGALLVVFVGSFALACSSSSGESAGDQGSSLSGCEGPLGKPVDPKTLTACCPDHPGKAHCVSTSKVPASLQASVGKCDGENSCVPDTFISTGGVFTPKKCTAFGAEGRCMSPCIPAVADKAALLKQDVCDEDELCVPCINPLDKSDTGVCSIVGKCAGT